jgi:hypothetical protein
MLSDAEGRKNRRELMRQIAREHKKRDRDLLQKLRAKIRDVKARRKKAMCMVKGSCRRGRVLARQIAKEKVRAIRERARQEISETRKTETARARAACKARKDQVKRAALSARLTRKETLRAERALQAEIKRIDNWTKERKRAHRATTAKEAREESDDAVRSNIPSDLRPLFERVKRSIKGSSRMSRTEEFLHYAEENPNEVIDTQEDLAQREVARLVREQYALETAMRHPARYRPSRAELAEVPF